MMRDYMKMRVGGGRCATEVNPVQRDGLSAKPVSACMSPNREGQAKMQEIVKRKAPVRVTGGGGCIYEHLVAARFLLDLLGGTNALGVDFGRITRIHWQARDSGWLADDLVIACKGPSG